RHADRARVPAVARRLDLLLANGAMRGRDGLRAGGPRALEIAAPEPPDLLDEPGKRGLAVAGDGEIHLRVGPEVVNVDALIEVLRADADRAAARGPQALGRGRHVAHLEP